jgi:transcription elongation factor Elf1
MLIPFNRGALALNEEFRKEVFKRLEQMGLTKKDLFKREKLLQKFYKSECYKSSLSVDIEKDLGLIQCRKTDKSIRKIKKPVIIKVDLYTVFKFYINLGYVFRDRNKKVYTMEEVEQLLINYYEKNNIEYKI